MAKTSSDGKTMEIEGVVIDVEAELAAAVEAERTQRPVRAKKRKNEPTLPTSLITPDTVIVQAAPPAPQAPQAAPQAPQAPQAAPPAPQAPQAAPQAPQAPQVAPPAPQAPEAAPPAPEADAPALPSAREFAVQLTRAMRRPDGFELPREERQRRTTLPAKARVLGPGEIFVFLMEVPAEHLGAFQLLSIDFPGFGASKLLVEQAMLDDAPLWKEGSVSAELFAPPVNLRQNRTPFAVLAGGSQVRLVVRNVSPQPVPVHPSITFAALEMRQQG